MCNSVVLSSKVGRKRKKKESGGSSENVICGCGLPARCCQPAVAGGIVYVDLWGELSTHLAPQALFVQSSAVRDRLHKLSPFQALGKVTLPLCCQACVFIYSSCGRWVFPPLLWSFPPTSAFTSFPAPAYWAVLLLLPAAMFVYSSHGKWVFPPLLGVFLPLPLSQPFPLLVAGRASPLPLEPLWPTRLVYLQSQEGFPSPNLRRSVRPTLFPACLICSYCLLLSFSFFPRWTSVCPGGYAALAQACLWEYRGTA
jgi:hypothetical protein